MKVESSLPSAQQPTTCPNPQPHESTQSNLILFRKIHFNIMLTSTSRPSRKSLPSGFPIKSLYASLLSPVFYVPSQFPRLLLQHTSLSCTNHEAPQYVISSSLLPLAPSYNQISSPAAEDISHDLSQKPCDAFCSMFILPRILVIPSSEPQVPPLVRCRRLIIQYTSICIYCWKSPVEM